MSFTLRPDQVTFRDTARQHLRRVRAALGVASCGFGKGVVTQEIVGSAASKGHHVLFLVHGRDRVDDAHQRATKLDIPHGVLMGGTRRERWHTTQIASSDTVYRMEHKPRADLIVIDECHLALSRSFREVLDFYPNSKILGLTATPCLGNGRALGVKSGGIFESMFSGPPVKKLISDGFLVGSRVMVPPHPTELSGLKKKKTGEFDENQGAAICDNSKVIGDVVDHWKRFASDRKAVAFGFNQKHAYDIAESFRAAGVNFAYVDANTPDGDIHTPGTRKFIWHQYDHGDLVGISSCNITSIGWDHSIAKVLLLCGKTSSFPLYHQRLGRGSRPHKGYDHFRIHDHTGNLYEFEDRGCLFESEIDWQLDGQAAPVKDIEKASRVATCKIPIKISEAGPALGFHGPVENGYMLPCLMTYAPGPKTCPFCGIPIVTRGREITAEDGELKEFTPEMHEKLKSPAQQAHEEKMRRRYMELARKGASKGYKPGWPAQTFSLEFHRWPTKAWKEEAVAMLAAEVASASPAAVRAAEVFSVNTSA